MGCLILHKSPNIKIQRTGADLIGQLSNLLPAADLERWEVIRRKDALSYFFVRYHNNCGPPIVELFVNSQQMTIGGSSCV